MYGINTAKVVAIVSDNEGVYRRRPSCNRSGEYFLHTCQRQ